MTKQQSTGNRCSVCGRDTRNLSTGRKRRYCSDACKQDAYRQRRYGGDDDRRMFATHSRVDVATLERMVGEYLANDESERAAAIRELAVRIGANLSEKSIESYRANHAQRRTSDNFNAIFGLVS